jgi:hypothetical protein
VCGVPYLPSVLLAILALAATGLLAVRALRALRRFATARNRFRGRMREGLGLLRARRAALRVAFHERWPGLSRRVPVPRTIAEQGEQERRG